MGRRKAKAINFPETLLVAIEYVPRIEDQPSFSLFVTFPEDEYNFASHKENFIGRYRLDEVIDVKKQTKEKEERKHGRNQT